MLALELMPTIGEGHVVEDIFTLDDASTVSVWARKNKLAGLHYWAYDRDAPCTNTTRAATCNKVSTKPREFYNAFRAQQTTNKISTPQVILA